MLSNAKRYNTVFFSLVVLLFIFITVYNNHNNTRKKYEHFLLNEYKNIPNYSTKDLTNIPKPEHPDLASYQNYFNTNKY